MIEEDYSTMKLENVGQALKSYFSGKPIWQALMPLDIVFLGVPLLLNLLTLCTVNIGFLSSLTLYLLIVGVLLAFANAHYMFLMGAFGLQALFQLIYLIKALASYGHYLSSSALIGLIVYGLLTWGCFTKLTVSK